MIDITKAQANQTTREGVDGEWTVTLDGKTLYKLPAHFTVQETFAVRGIVEKMMNMAADETKAQQQQYWTARIEQITTNGDAKLNALAAENVRLAEFIENKLEVA